jgi:hypothetical protein
MLGVTDDACTFTPTKEEESDEENGRAEDGTPGKELTASAGLKAGVDEHAAPVTVTVAVESNRTVSMPSRPLELNVDMPFATPVDAGAEDDEVTIPPKLKVGEEIAVGVPGEDKGVIEMALEGTIPPKLNVPVGDEELNWRLFSWMTDGEGAGPLRLMMDGEGPGPLRSMMEGLLETCGAAA